MQTVSEQEYKHTHEHTHEHTHRRTSLRYDFLISFVESSSVHASAVYGSDRNHSPIITNSCFTN